MPVVPMTTTLLYAAGDASISASSWSTLTRLPVRPSSRWIVPFCSHCRIQPFPSLSYSAIGEDSLRLLRANAQATRPLSLFRAISAAGVSAFRPSFSAPSSDRPVTVKYTRSFRPCWPITGEAFAPMLSFPLSFLPLNTPTSVHQISLPLSASRQRICTSWLPRFRLFSMFAVYRFSFRSSVRSSATAAMTESPVFTAHTGRRVFVSTHRSTPPMSA